MLAHDMSHAARFETDRAGYNRDTATDRIEYGPNGEITVILSRTNPEEERANDETNEIAGELDEPERPTYLDARAITTRRPYPRSGWDFWGDTIIGERVN
jgi:hypothetical protein